MRETLGMVRKVWIAAAVVISLLAAQVPRSVAQSFPTQPIRIVVGAGVSTPSDILSRVLATELTNSEKWTVIVENRPGASQVIGGTEVQRSPADGPPIFNSGLPIAAAPALQSKLPFDLLKVKCVLDERTYEKGIKISKAEMATLAITGDAFHPEWNYTIKPRRQQNE